MLTSKDIECLKTQLPDLSESTNPLTDTVNDNQLLKQSIDTYCNFYSINFAGEFPRLRNSMHRLLSNSHVVVTQSWHQPQPKALLFVVHGYLDHVGLLGHIIRFGLQQHYAVVAFDLPGHGLSDGEPAAISSFDEYTRVLSDVIDHYKTDDTIPCYLVGQSTGGAVVADYLFEAVKTKQGLSGIEKAALLAPLVRPWGWGAVGGLYSLLRHFIKRTKRTFTQNTHNLAFIKFQKEQDPLQSKWIPWIWLAAMSLWIGKVKLQKPVQFPVLVIQGKLDRTVDFHYNIKAYQRCFSGAKINWLAEGKHQLLNESEVIRDELFSMLGMFLNE